MICIYPVRTRFAPSPTGDLHIGGARTALFSWLVARHFGGKFLLRIEDTDQTREKPGALNGIFEGLNWLGINWDEPPLYQSERIAIYRSFLDQMLQSGHAYYCTCSVERLDRLRQQQLDANQKPKYDWHCRNLNLKFSEISRGVVRFKTPKSGISVFSDVIRKDVSICNEELDDLIIWRSPAGPTYNFCVVIDDWLSNITHVIRGEDHINNTHRQRHIAQALGAPEMIYAHVPMILDEEGKKLSKRRASSGLLTYRDQGFLPQALMNYLAKLGWGYKNQELFSPSELIQLFSLDHVKPSSCAFNQKKLEWINKKHLNCLVSPEELSITILSKVCALRPEAALLNKKDFNEALILYRTRGQSTDHLAKLLIDFFYPELSEKWKNLKGNCTFDHTTMYGLLENLIKLKNWIKSDLSSVVFDFLSSLDDENQGRRLLRLIWLGQESSPALPDVLYALGRQRSLERLNKFLIDIF